MNDISTESFPDDRDAGAFSESESLFAYALAVFGAVTLSENGWRLPKTLRSLGVYDEFIAELHPLAALNTHELLSLFAHDRPHVHGLFAAAAQAYAALDRAARRHTREPLDLMPLIPADAGALANALEERTEDYQHEIERRRRVIDPTVKQLQAQLNTIRELLERAEVPPSDDLARLRDDIDAKGDRLLDKAWLQLNHFAERQSAARRKRPEEIAADIADLHREIALEGRDHDRDLLIDSMGRLHAAIEAGLRANVLSFAKRLGAIELPPLPAIPLMCVDDLLTRKEIADKIAAHYRRPPVYFEDHEIAGLRAECMRNSFASTRFARILERVFDEEAVLMILRDLAQQEARR